MPRGRGRGRGGRGRGSSRNRTRGSSGRGRSTSGAAQQVTDEWGVQNISTTGEVAVVTDEVGFNSLFVGLSTTDQHYDAQQKDRECYLATLAVLEKNGAEILQGSRIRALAAAWARTDLAMVNIFLAKSDLFGLVEILKALTLLDSGRRVREFEKKMRRLEMTGKVKRKTIGKLKSNIDNLNAIKPKVGSVSGAVAKHVRQWVKTVPAQQLEFYALHFPKEPWKRLADMCHFHPEKDFPNLPWFLRYCYGGSAPDGSMVQSCTSLNSDNVNELIQGHDVPYAHIKDYKGSLMDESKARIAEYEKELDTVLWYYEDLACELTDQMILKRLQGGDPVNLTYGKLMERLLTLKMKRENISGRGSGGDGFRTEKTATDDSLKKAPFYDLLIPIAEKQLQSMSVPLEAPVVVIGDASPSMNVAIRTSTIIASLLTAICHAQLVFFHSFLMKPPFYPESVTQALELATTVQTSHMTAPAAGLYDFYERKEVVKTFIVVTDEEENTAYKGYRFKELFKKYFEEVYPAKLVFVSFLRSQHSKGQMVTELQNNNINVLHFKLDSNRPDLTKLDNLLGILSTGSSSFQDEVKKIASQLKAQGITNTFKKLKLDNTTQEEETQDTSLQTAAPQGDAAQETDKKTDSAGSVDDSITKQDDGDEAKDASDQNTADKDSTQTGQDSDKQNIDNTQGANDDQNPQGCIAT
ncbi:uncharacterized protein LOC144432683 [Glandiceps talaboti]